MTTRRDFLMTLPVACAGAQAWAAARTTSRCWVYFGSHDRIDRGEGRRIYVCSFDLSTGKCGDVTTAARLSRPTWLAASPDGERIYSVSGPGLEVDADGSLAGFAVDRGTGALRPLNQVSSRGGDPTHVGLDRSGRVAVVANYGGGSTVSFPIGKGGTIGVLASLMQHTGRGPHRRQAAPHAHAAVVSPDNRFVLTPDLGADRIFVYRLDASRGTLVANDPPFEQTAPGLGPRHLAFHPGGQFAYLMTEMAGRILVFSWNSGSGLLKEIQTVDAYPAGYAGGRSGAEIEVDGAGRFLYASTRIENSLTVFAIDPAQGTLMAVDRVPSGGDTPWSFRIDPTGRFMLVANDASNEVVVFRLDAQTGKLVATGEAAKVPGPTCVVFVAAQP